MAYRRGRGRKLYISFYSGLRAVLTVGFSNGDGIQLFHACLRHQGKTLRSELPDHGCPLKITVFSSL